MELWIRSQDKMDIVKVKDIHIAEIPSSIEVEIIGYYYDKSYTTLGYYKTKERALEVLDEIQRLMIASLIDKNLDGYSVVICEMPID